MNQTLKLFLVTVLLLLLTCLGAQVEIPLGPVPFILSDFFILLAGLILGARWTGFMVSSYLLLGGLGLPVFAGGGSGFKHLLGPTAGFLFGFLLAGILVGFIAESGPAKLIRDGLATLTGQFTFFFVGLIWLYSSTTMSWAATFENGLFPFWWPIAIKWSAAVLVSFLFRYLGGKNWLQSH